MELNRKSILEIAMGFGSLSLKNLFSRGGLSRQPEPHALTDTAKSVEEYDKALNSIMSCCYALAYNTIQKMGGLTSEAVIYDLCCGPGHFTRGLATHLGVQKVIGVELSDEMLSCAKKRTKISNVQFEKFNVCDLSGFADQSANMVTWLNGAHHLDSLKEVGLVLAEAERVVKKDGAIFVMEPERPKNERILKSYVRLTGDDYIERGLNDFHQQFVDSLYASWSKEELISAIPADSQRTWLYLSARGFSPFHMLIGLPEGKDKLDSENGLTDSILRTIVPESVWNYWALMKLAYSAPNQIKIKKRVSD